MVSLAAATSMSWYSDRIWATTASASSRAFPYPSCRLTDQNPPPGERSVTVGLPPASEPPSASSSSVQSSG